jgi:hypothetical protein
MILGVVEDDNRLISEIQALNTGLAFPPINTVRLDDLEVVAKSTKDLIGHIVIINKSDYSQVNEMITSVSKQKVNLDLSKKSTEVETNVYFTVINKITKSTWRRYL